MSNWIKLDLDMLTATSEEQVTIRGVRVTLHASPYDVPEAVRVGENPSTHNPIIEFKYVGEEPQIRQAQTDHVWLHIGKHSRRLYGIELDVRVLNALLNERRPTVRQAVTGAVSDLLRNTSDPARMNNYKIAEEALKGAREELYAALVTA